MRSKAPLCLTILYNLPEYSVAKDTKGYSIKKCGGGTFWYPPLTKIEICFTTPVPKLGFFTPVQK